MKIAIEGCAHGQLDIIYETIQHLEENENIKVDLLICCGDFQACRNEEDLRCMAVPPKYYDICSFYKYYNGEKVAPILTIFIGGNHEASNYLQELPYGGWVAPNIYYLGYCSVITVAGVRIGGISGIYKPFDYPRGHFEKPPYNEQTKRSVYHVRNVEVFRLKQVSQLINIFVSHDWPSEVHKHGNFKHLLRKKPHFKPDVEAGKLGSKPCQEVLNVLKPQYWFAAHLHCKFAAIVYHSEDQTTKFLALDKCLPSRRFLQILDVPHDADKKIEINYDLEWLTILHLTNHLLSVKPGPQYMPGPNNTERWEFTPTNDELSFISRKFSNNLVVPNNFVKSAPGYGLETPRWHNMPQPQAQVNPQTTLFCEILGVNDPLEMLLSVKDGSLSNNISFGSDTSFNQTTFIADTESESDISQSPSKQRLIQPLMLPKVRNESNLDVENVAQCTTTFSEDVGSGDLVVDDFYRSEGQEGSPTPKKLKRRNLQIYEIRDTDL